MTQYFSMWGNLTIRENLLFIARLYSLDQRRDRVERALSELGLTARQHQLAKELSGGWKQRMALAACMLHEPVLLFLDEPTAFLDFPSKVEIMQLLHHLSRSTNKTIFLSTHDLELALQIADKIWLMDKANGVTIGTPEDLSIDGCLSNFFSRKGIVFDMETGLFRIDNEFEKEVRLVGHGNKYAMVRKALQRNGILASRRVESDFYIETGDMTTSGYIIHPVAGRTIKVDTIEELLEQVTAILASV